MKRFDNPIKNLGYLAYRWIVPIFDPIKVSGGLWNYPRYFKSGFEYSKMYSAEPIKIINTYPILDQKTLTTPFDSHYFYQDIWAAKKIYNSKTKTHHDIGSNIEFVSFLTAFTKVKFVDIRPIKANLSNFESIKASILDLPFKNNSIKSLSCLHVAEHIGLGRYGDPLDPEGTKKACKELSRVLAKGGNLYFSLPVGVPRLCFNAHRIHSPTQILRYFEGLKLKELSGIDDNGRFIQNIDIKVLERSDYACGLFRFTKV